MFNNYEVSIYDKQGLYDIHKTEIIAESESHAFNILIKKVPVNLGTQNVFIKKIADGTPKLKSKLVEVDFDENGKVKSSGSFKSIGEFDKEFNVVLRLNVENVSLVLLDDGKNISADFYNNVNHKHIKYLGSIHNHLNLSGKLSEIIKKFLEHELHMLKDECDSDIYRYHGHDPMPEWITNLMILEPLIPNFNKLVEDL